MIQPLKIIIVEDEFLIAQDLKIRLEAMHFEVIGIAHSPEEFWPLFTKDLPDLCILDIDLDQAQDGIHLGHEIKKQHNLPIIFLSSHSDIVTVARAKDVNPAAYMLKPFNDRELQIAIELAVANAARPNPSIQEGMQAEEEEGLYLLNDSIFIKKKERFWRVRFKDILWIEAQSNYSLIKTEKEQFTLAITLGEVERRIHDTAFFRVNRSYIVNLEKVEAFRGNMVYIHDTSFVVSKARRPLLFNYFNII